MAAGRIALFGLAACGMIAAANASDLVDRAPALIKEIGRDLSSLRDNIRADCKFRHPDSAGVADACFRRQYESHIVLRDAWWKTPDRNSRGITLICMDENQTLNGFDWTSTARCYERNIVALRRKS